MKREKTKVKNTNKGITLIALVITIIIAQILISLIFPKYTEQHIRKLKK